MEWDGWDAPLQSPQGLSVNATPFTKNLEGSEEEPYGISVGQEYIDGDIDVNPCGVWPTLWFTNEVHTENKYLRQTLSKS